MICSQVARQLKLSVTADGLKLATSTSQSWELSGLSVSKATYWAFVLEESVIFVPRYHVDWACRMYGKPITCNIQPNNSRGFLIRPEHLLEAAEELN
jgi:hypothetical protein